MTLQCAKCNQNKSLEEFSNAKRNVYRQGKHSYCKACMYLYGKEHRQQNIEKYRTRSRAAYISSFEQKLKALLRVTSSDRSALDYKEMLALLESQKYRCAVSKIKMTYDVRSPTTMSIDRIDPSKGYTIDNVRFVCWWINVAMSNWGEEKLRELIKEWMDNE